MLNATLQETQRSVGVKFVFAEGKRKTRRAHFILEDQFRGRKARYSFRITISDSTCPSHSGEQRARERRERWRRGPPASTPPIKPLRNWMIHDYWARVLITITEQVNSSPGLRIPAADGALAPVCSLKTFPPVRLGRHDPG